MRPLEGWLVSLIWSYGDMLCYLGYAKERNDAFAKLQEASDQYQRASSNEGARETLFRSTGGRL